MFHQPIRNFHFKILIANTPNMWQIMKNCARKLCQMLGAFWWPLVSLERCGGAIVYFCTNLPLFYSCYLLLPDKKRNTQYLLNLDSKMKKNLSNSLLFVPTIHRCMQSRRGCTPIIQGQNWNSYNNRPLLYSLVIVNWTKMPHEFWFFHLNTLEIIKFWLLIRQLQH